MLGITRRQRLAASQTVSASVTLVDATGLTFPVTAGKKYHFRINGGFTLGATGGFKFRLDAPALGVGSNYNNNQQVTDGVTASPGAVIANSIVALADFANALAVAGNHTLDMEGDYKPDASGNLKLQFACNSAANAIILLQGFYMEVTSL